jgi:archaellum biogenesis ATPase FlaH
MKEITNSINLKDENLTKKDVVIICSGTRDVAKTEANDVLRILSEFAKLTLNTNVTVMCVPHHFDLQPSSCISKEVELLNRKLQDN